MYFEIFSLTTQPSTAGKDDFVTVTKSITFQPGERGPKSIEIELVDDLLDESTEAFTISLTSTSAVTLGPAAFVNIIDNDGKLRNAYF